MITLLLSVTSNLVTCDLAMPDGLDIGLGQTFEKVFRNLGRFSAIEIRIEIWVGHRRKSAELIESWFQSCCSERVFRVFNAVELRNRPRGAAQRMRG
jgi:hypothetical protein